MTRHNRINNHRKTSFVFKLIGIAILGVLALGIGYILPFFFNYVKPGIHLKTASATNQQINILLLGIGGGTHDGPNLTDTIMFASINQKENKISLISIPRDLWNPTIGQKINATYADAIDKDPQTALQVTKSTISNVIGEPIQYGFRIDFGGFVKAVDEVGGLDINVDRDLDDYVYPIEGSEDDTCGQTQQQITDWNAQEATGSATDDQAFPCRYMHLHISKGPQHMDGTTALEYVRSRHAIGIEGTDFARARRQQKVIEAFRAKLLSADTILNPAKVISLFTILRSSIDTDITQDDLPDFIKLAQDMKNAKIDSYVIGQDTDNNGQEGLLVNPPVADYNGAWVLIPQAGESNYSQIHAFVQCTVNNIGCPTPTPTPSPLVSPTAAVAK